MDAFSPLTAESLGWYVYLLSDPADDHPVYIGKGIRSRAFEHAVDARRRADEAEELQSAKVLRIRQIGAAGREVRVEVLRHGLATEKAAYEVEAAAIDLANSLAPGTLLNIVLGHHHAQHGLMAAEELEILYAAKPAPRVEVPVLLVSLNKYWSPRISDTDLYDYTRGWWRVSARRVSGVAYVMGVHNGVVRSVYRPVSWRQRTADDRDYLDDADGRPRWAFDGVPAPEMGHFLRTSVRRFLVQQWSHLYVGPEAIDAPAPTHRPRTSALTEPTPSGRSVGSLIRGALAQLAAGPLAGRDSDTVRDLAASAQRLEDLPLELSTDTDPGALAAIGAAVERITDQGPVDPTLLTHLTAVLAIHPQTPLDTRHTALERAGTLRQELTGDLRLEGLLRAASAYAVRLFSMGSVGAIANTFPSMVSDFVEAGPHLGRLAFHHLAEAICAFGSPDDESYVRDLVEQDRPTDVAWGTFATLTQRDPAALDQQVPVHATRPEGTA